jgi:hypothetical protein
MKAQMKSYVLATLLVLSNVKVAFSEPALIMDIASRRELFVDDYLIDRFTGKVRLKLHHPQRQPYPPNAPPETIWASVLKDEDTFRMLVRGQKDPSVRIATHGLEKLFSNHVLLYYESADGITWTAPDLGLYDLPRYPEGNVVMADRFGVEQTFAAFVDTRPGSDPAHRYKGLGGKAYPEKVEEAFTKKYGAPGLRAFASPDGIQWTAMHGEPVIPGNWGRLDSQNVVFWSSHESRYICYFRVFGNAYMPDVRTVKRTTSTDFLNWTTPEDVNINLPGEHLYTTATHPYYRAPHIYIATPTRYLPERGSSTDILFMTTRDGLNFDRTFNEAFIRPGLDAAHWANRANYTANWIVPTSDAELSIYMGGPRHYTLRIDGFASVNASYDGGELLTKPLTFQGARLSLNCSTSAAGRIRAEIQGITGKPIDGFSLDQADPIIGDSLDVTAQWTGNSDVSALAGIPVRLRLVMEDADIYSLRFE